LFWGSFSLNPNLKNKKETFLNQSKNVSSTVMIDLDDAVMHGYADSNGALIPHGSLGKGGVNRWAGNTVEVNGVERSFWWRT
jgi:hypothetical protein